MMEKMQARLDESEKKIELMAITLQTFIKDIPNDVGQKPYNGEKEDDKKEEEGEKHSSNQYMTESDRIIA